MLQIYGREGNQLVALSDLGAAGAKTPLWVDLLSPTVEEDAAIEKLLGITIPSREEMEEIELSSRLYREDGAEFMTIVALTKLDTDEPTKTPVSFIIRGETLVTVRYAEPKPFAAYAARAMRPKGVPCATGEQVMLGIIEAMIDRDADALERAGNEIDQISRSVFKKQQGTANMRQRRLRVVIEQIGAKEDLLTMVQESLVSIARLVTYHATIDGVDAPPGKEARTIMEQVKADALSLGDHARALSNKITFLLDATLGLINLEQNQIIKLFSVAAVVFLPPTLVASIYGMNFHLMPELSWEFGYPMAIGLMVLSAVLPYLYFKKRGWL